MKRILSFTLAAMLLPLALGAQLLAPQGESYGQNMLGGPSRIDLPSNQKILGHYDSDAYSTVGWRQQGRTGVIPIATDMTPSELAMFQGGRIVAIRLALAQSTPVTRVFVIPIAPDGYAETTTAWSCNVEQVGWNTIELETPYEIDLPEDYSLRVGFDYKQTGTNYPVSAVAEGEIYDSYWYLNKWYTTKLRDTGNLSVQCIVESDHFPEYHIEATNLVMPHYAKIGETASISFKVRNRGTGTVEAGAFTYEVAIDGNPVGTFTNSMPFGQTFVTLNADIPCNDLEAGTHTLTVTTTTINGEPVIYSITLSGEFIAITQGFARQKRLVEQFTSTGCTFCPQGTTNIANLTAMRDDIAWVAIHENMTGHTDPFRTLQCDSITVREGVDGFPEGTFDRTVGLSSSTSIWAVLTNLQAATMSSFLDYVEDLAPSWATVNINSTYDPNTRQAVITIDGELVSDFEDRMGADSKLTVYITEDGLVAPQTSGGNNYVHNNVLRKALGSVLGVKLNKTGDSYKNEFNIEIPGAWNADNLSIVAFISRPLRSGALTDLYVTNANKRKLGEYDEPTFIPGDVDESGTVNISDVTLLIQYLLSGSSDGINMDAADYNGDSAVNVTDVTELIQLLLSN